MSMIENIHEFLLGFPFFSFFFFFFLITIKLEVPAMKVNRKV